MTTQETIALFDNYVIANYGRLPRVMVKGEGSYLYDADGHKILDMFPGWAVSGIGHCHPKVVEAVRRQVGELIHIDNTFYSEPQGKLAQLLSERAFGGKCFFCNSGAEANEAALKLSRLHTAKGKYKFITAEGSFHGRTFATVTATAQPKYHDGFLPLLPGFAYIPFNDVAALEAAFTDEVAAVMVEPIQGEGGINVATAEFLGAIRELCDAKGAIMILDEVQTGIGRTGKWFAYQHYDVEPDIITMAKALGGGVAIGAMMARPEIAASLVPGKHASTFGGNCLACAAGVATIEAIEEDGLLRQAAEIGQYAQDKLRSLKDKHAIIDHVRGIGLMIGIQLMRPGAAIVAACLEKGLRINCTHDTVIRFMPPMTVTREQIDEAIGIFDNVLSGS
ncbi:MAG: aspartate aminotransferase family protein [Sedimentisphaerales bacterium]|jgi:predicted acetylornithine/succinylornithine family transaminase|nr:aspartate aminotransferase family protein [Sedimentisphaerales bacterium]HNY79343.1 aspartate aminotransferase family protein [Sedimentisphaerales bacterium]HOC64459.1 aspartate aminotransferase family protein [Sedimentisphaerales bacterium]HOH63322.1 aspartate aminotransferase family protein [Sedimentisphaerales bacterium]HQA91807.1 aspartate aminotransferase family protein [Sedimentisphaerales bacterium]